MPIRINLLAEAQAAEEARRRDPVKRAILVAGVLILLMVVWGGYELSRTMVANSDFEAQDKIWKSMAATYGQVKTNEARSKELEKKLSALTDLSTNRFLWGSALNALQPSLSGPNNLVDQIQFIRVSGNHSYLQNEGTPAKKQDGRTIPGKPAQATERISLMIEGKDYGNPNEQNYLRLRTNLWNLPFFQSRLGSIDAIQLKNFNPQQIPDTEGKMFSTFVLECKFPEKKREER